MKKPLYTFLVLLSFLFLAPKANAHDLMPKQEERIISLSGEASVSSPPDMAVIDFTIETQDLEFRKAREENAEISAKVLNAVRAIKLSEKNINLKNMNVNEYREYDAKQRKSIFKGYKAIRNFQVSIYKKDLKDSETLSDKVAQTVNATSESGITRLGSVTYSIEDDKELKNRALAQAVLNAKEKAQILLAGLDAKLGKVKTVSENTYAPRPYIKSYARTLMSMDSETSSMPEPEAYSEGDMTVTTKINVSFYID